MMPKTPLLNLTVIDPPAGLLDKVLGKIHAARLRRLRTRLSVAVFAACATLAYVAANWSAMWAELQRSSFVEMLRLTLSDSDIMLDNAKDAILGLLETIPLETVLLTLISCFFLVAAYAFFSDLRHERRAFSLNHLM